MGRKEFFRLPDWTQMRQWLEAMYFVAVILGIPLFFLQQAKVSEFNRVNQTLTFVSLFQQEPLLSARNKLLQSWESYEPDLMWVNQVGGVDQETVDIWVNKMIQVSAGREGSANLGANVLLVSDFFDQLYFCIEAEACSATVAKKYFGDFANEFDALYGGYVHEKSKSLNARMLGRGLGFLSSGQR